MYHGHVASITRTLAGDLHQQVVVNARTFRLRGVEVQCMNSELCFTYLRVVAVGELEVEGDTRGGLAGGDHVVGVLHLPGGEGGHFMAVVHLGSSSMEKGLKHKKNVWSGGGSTWRRSRRRRNHREVTLSVTA